MRQARQLWSEQFDRELKDIFDVQDEIARAIVERLKVTLGGSANARLVQRVTPNIDAYELLLKGRVLLTRRGRAIHDALNCFECGAARCSRWRIAARKDWRHSGLRTALMLLATAPRV